MSENIVIVAAGRTAVGTFGGTLSALPANELGATVAKALLERTGIAADQVDEVILGQVLTAGTGQNPARQTTLKAGPAAQGPGHDHQQGLRQRAQGGASGDAGGRLRRRRDRHRRRPGEHEPVAAMPCRGPATASAWATGRWSIP